MTNITKYEKKKLPGYIHRNLKSIEDISNLNTKGFKSLKDVILVSINSNNPLEVSKNLKKQHADDLEKVKTFIKHEIISDMLITVSPNLYHPMVNTIK